MVPLCLLVGCETTQPASRYYLSSYRGMEEHVGAFGNKAMVKTIDANRFERYDRVIIEDIKVLPSKSKDPQFREATKAEAEALAEKFEDFLEKEFAKSFEITRYRSYKTLTVRAALTDIEASNPALFAVNYMPYAGLAATGYQLLDGDALGAGSTTMEIEILDSRSRRQLWAMVDRLKGGKLQPGSLSKFGQTEMAMQAWAKKTYKAAKGKRPMTPMSELNEANSSTSSTTKKKTTEKKEKKPLFGKPKED
ncbi:MAG: DUF3313 domain-containing protein [Verrucomicrobiota bacterium]